MICPECRDVASFHEHRPKTFTTLVGEARVTARPYYHCPHCHSGYYPGDEALGWEGRRLRPGVERVVALGGTLTSFGAAATKILPKMTGIRLGETTVARTTEAVGNRLGQFWARGHGLGAARAWEWNRDQTGRRVASVSVDATGVGQQGPGGVKAEGKMVDVGMVYNPAAPDPDTLSDARPVEQARSLAGLYDLGARGAQRRRQAGQVGRDQADLGIGLTDGGQGLDDFLRVDLPRAVLILDFYHAAGHLADLAQAWSCDPASAQALLDRWCHQMKHEGGPALLRTLGGLDRSDRARRRWRRIAW